MNQALKEALGIIVRQALLSLGTALGLQTIIAPDSTVLNTLVQQIVAAIMVAAPVIYAQFAQHFKRQKLMQALITSARVSEATIERMVKDELVPTPSVTTDKHQVPV